MIGLDLGTTSCKAVVLRADGSIAATAGETYPLQVRHPGWAEQDPAVLAGAALRTLAAVAGAAGPDPEGITLSGAMHSSFPVAADGAALAPAMTWADNRAVSVVERVRAEVDAASLYARTGCPVRSTYHPVRLRWWADEAPDLARRARWYLGLKDWVLHALTGARVTDVGMASTTGLLAMASLDWDAEALAVARVGRDQLPRLVDGSAEAGGLGAAAAAATGLPRGLPVIAGGSDGGMANLGTGLVEPGHAVITVGTSGAVRHTVDRPWTDPEERTWCYALDRGQWFIGGAINNGGLALDWVRRLVYPDPDPAAGFAQLAVDAGGVAPGADGVFVLPYFTGERSPDWTPDASATIHGLRLEHGRAHLARAAMEGVAHCLADVWQALPPRPAGPDATRLTGGITRTPVWAQILADVLDEPLMALDVADASAVGAARLGRRALGLDASRAEAVPQGPVYTPGAAHAFYAAHHRAYDALRAATLAVPPVVVGAAPARIVNPAS